MPVAKGFKEAAGAVDKSLEGHPVLKLLANLFGATDTEGGAMGLAGPLATWENRGVGKFGEALKAWISPKGRVYEIPWDKAHRDLVKLPKSVARQGPQVVEDYRMASHKDRMRGGWIRKSWPGYYDVKKVTPKVADIISRDLKRTPMKDLKDIRIDVGYPGGWPRDYKISVDDLVNSDFDLYKLVKAVQKAGKE